VVPFNSSDEAGNVGKVETVTKIVTRAQQVPAALARRANDALESLSVAVENRWYPKAHQGRLLILDDTFPNLLSPFRIAEFNVYLERFGNAVVYSTTETFEDWLEKYNRYYSQFSDRVHPFKNRRKLRGRAAYVVFLHNIFRFLDTLEEASLPFVFTLYPGGDFRLDERVSDDRLRRVLSSPMFRKVIVTQNVTRDYLIGKGFCDPADIDYIFGGVLPLNQFAAKPVPSRRYGVDKDTLDVCFVANKYTPKGVDKGYDRFIETARLLIERHHQTHFHIVGAFNESDVDVSDFRDQITFYGRQYTSFFPNFYAGMDIILSPNVPFALAPGAFDGFPTGCCVEAGLCGVAVFCTDELSMNDGIFKDSEEIVIVSREPREICESVKTYTAEPERLARLAKSGQQAFQRIFDLDRQMAPRLRALSSLISVGE